ncbi:hypothetical protein TSACC_21189 [Terrimicrobium sacchariphilum]|uniref:Tetratricopeptide repeat-containing protein n=1 Tax=Terrimicrobium sacchariphilum TaxID=690879 RepID=A0A146G7C8_TERSA|nr:hypothetical protein [Terrimicrobium sacchariphilum]GAT32787.1 hypothetical protein TSACC_21189 [Terrimicrobium sacchariphilum]
MKHFPLILLLAGTGIAFAQGDVSSEFKPGQAGQAQPAPANSGGAAAPANGGGGGGTSFLGKDMPVFDPGSEIVSWDGKNWNINNNRLLEARFEKYLNSPPAVSEADEEYQKILQSIMDKLAPGRVTPKSSDEAFQLLAKASQYPDDARLCDAIANQVYSAWLARKNGDRVNAANRSLEEERKRLEWNARITAKEKALDKTIAKTGGGGNVKGAEFSGDAQAKMLEQDMEMQPIITRLAEVNALMKANQLKKEVAELQVKIEFQALIIQHFLQRRFQHVLIGTRFYRSIFSDGDSQLRVGEDAKSLFAKTTGMPPTVGTLDSTANEIIRDVRQGIDAFKFLIEKSELESATKRLAETFLIGEYLPEVRTLDREDKRKALAFVKTSNQLISAIDVKDYTLADKLVKQLSETARDFDSSKPTAAIETAKQVSAMHIAKARNAAVSGDKATLETELRSATEIWPRNPALAEVSGLIFSQADVQSRALVDFDQLLSQKNHRQIYDDKMRFIAATAMYPDKQEQLRQVLDEMQQIETAIIQAQEIEKRGDYAGAWESAEKAFRQYPDDNKLNQLRADLTTKAAEFVRALRQAEDLEKRNQPGSSLAWYLKAQSVYPSSDFAREGVQRVTKELFPDSI